MGDIATITTAIKTTLDVPAIAAKTVQEGYGRIDQLLQTPTALPAVFVVYGGGQFMPQQRTDRSSDGRHKWSIFAVARAFREDEDAAGPAANLIEKATQLLQGTALNDGEVVLWPLRVDMVYSENGVVVYALEVQAAARLAGA